MHIENRGEAGSVVYPPHSDDEGHEYRLADAFGAIRLFDAQRFREGDRGSFAGLQF
jgi:hypothetical protein